MPYISSINVYNVVMSKKELPSRGTTLHVPNRFFALQNDKQEAFSQIGEPEPVSEKTKYIEVVAKSMINTVQSPDLAMDYSLNPYQGCEHGCTYCYARLSHNYWGYSIADEFETNILVKTNALDILKKELASKQYLVKPIMLSGNTDCYQPAEARFKLTRKILELFVMLRHPVQLITKNALILRDLDVLKELKELELVSVAISITASQDKTRRKMEPRASTIASRLKTIETLSTNKIPVHAMLAPIIPGINDVELVDMLKLASSAGAKSASYQIVRLNGELPVLFSDWLDSYYPDRKNKILNAIKTCHAGQLNDSNFSRRMKGEGPLAESIKQQFKLAYSRYFPNPKKLKLKTDLFKPIKNGQLQIF